LSRGLYTELVPLSCCDDFVRLHSNLGRRGFSIKTETVSPGQVRATLHFNAVPPGEEERLGAALKPAKLVAQAVGRETISHCPFCGARLGS
jgi:hypothetical protein